MILMDELRNTKKRQDLRPCRFNIVINLLSKLLLSLQNFSWNYLREACRFL